MHTAAITRHVVAHPAPWVTTLPDVFPGWTPDRVGALRVWRRHAVADERVRVCVWAGAHPDEPAGTAALVAHLSHTPDLPHVTWAVCVRVDARAQRNAPWVRDPTLPMYARHHWRPDAHDDIESCMPVDHPRLQGAATHPVAGDLAAWLRADAPHVAITLHADALAGDHAFLSAAPTPTLLDAWRDVSAAVGCPTHRAWPLASVSPWGHTDVFADTNIAHWLDALARVHGASPTGTWQGPVPLGVFAHSLPRPPLLVTLETGVWTVPGLDNTAPTAHAAADVLHGAARRALHTMDQLGDLPGWDTRRAWLRELEAAAPTGMATHAHVAGVQRLRVLELWCAGEAARAGMPGATEVLQHVLDECAAAGITLADPHAAARSLWGRMLAVAAARSR